jgi:hypothetical protein
MEGVRWIDRRLDIVDRSRLGLTRLPGEEETRDDGVSTALILMA